MQTLYVLTRTSGRPEFFRVCRESVKSLTGFRVVHIVHCDDPLSEHYIDCDILVRGEAHGPWTGTAPYNLYNNRLLKSIPAGRPGWVHFIDDDDYYVAPDVFEKMLHNADRRKVHVGKVDRLTNVWPKHWGTQMSYQTECFATWSDLARNCTWWAYTGGDHFYSRQLTKKSTGVEWNDVMIARAQEGKMHGKLVDRGGRAATLPEPHPNTNVALKWFERKSMGQVKTMPYREAKVFEKHGVGRITYKGVERCYISLTTSS